MRSTSFVRSRGWGRFSTVFAASLLAAFGIAETARGVDLYVDFSVADDPGFVSTTPNDVQSGYTDFSPAPTFDGSDGIDRTNRTNFAQTISGVSITIAGGGNGLQFYDISPDVTHPLGDLLEDGVMTFDAFLSLRIVGLPAGSYTFTGFHHRSNLEAPHPPLDIYLGDDPVPVVSGIVASSGYEPSSVTTSTFGIEVLGLPGESVLITFDGKFDPAGSTPVYLNGFSIVEVPEPSTVCLLAIGAMVLAFGRLRKRR